MRRNESSSKFRLDRKENEFDFSGMIQPGQQSMDPQSQFQIDDLDMIFDEYADDQLDDLKDMDSSSASSTAESPPAKRSKSDKPRKNSKSSKNPPVVVPLDTSASDYDSSMQLDPYGESDAGSHPKKASKSKKGEKTALDKLAAKEKNREHAKNTRIRKKNFVEALKESIRQLMEEQEEVDRDRKVSINRVIEQTKTRKKVLQDVLNQRCNGTLDIDIWNTLVEEEFVLSLPITPYRSFPPSEVSLLKKYYNE
jgi:hypothetical protein